MKFKDLLNGEQKSSLKKAGAKSTSAKAQIAKSKDHLASSQAKHERDDENLFASAMQGVKPLSQDKTVLKTNSVKKFSAKQQSLKHKQIRQDAQFYFSDEFEPNLEQSGPMKYVREDVNSYETKRLRRGDYAPEIMLDLHGLKQEQAKLEIAGLISECQKSHIHCACIVHGLGGYILKQKVPHWLVQHPNVQAFHQAPLEWGGDGALLLLIDVPED